MPHFVDNPTENNSISMQIALYQPDIPQNTGTILRMAACLGLSAHIIGPAGFNTSDRAFRRAGLDYLNDLAIQRHESFAAFETARLMAGHRLILMTTYSDSPFHRFSFHEDDIIMVGRESAGAPESVHGAADARLRIPMHSGLRSLNVAMSAALVVGEALRQTDGFEAGDLK